MPNLQTQRTICRRRGPEPEIPGALVQSALGLHRVAEIELPPLTAMRSGGTGGPNGCGKK